MTRASTLPDLLRFEGHSVRIEIDEHGEPWFCARDVGDCLGISKQAVSKALGELAESETRSFPIKSTSSGLNRKGRPPVYVLESGLYHLAIQSRKPAAERFRRWIRQEVLPSIRKTGSFSVLSPAEQLALLVDQVLTEERQKRLVAETKVEELRPAAEFAERLTASGRAISLTDAARVGKVSRTTLIDTCRARSKWLFRTGGNKGPLRAYASQTDQVRHGTKRFVHVTTSEETGARTQVKITFKGLRDALQLILGEDAPEPGQLSIDFDEVAS